MNTYDLVLCQTTDGFSLHAPGSTDEQIAEGDALALVSGEGEPTQAHYDQAIAHQGGFAMTLLNAYQNWSTGKIVYRSIDAVPLVMYRECTVVKETGEVLQGRVSGARWIVEASQ